MVCVRLHGGGARAGIWQAVVVRWQIVAAYTGGLMTGRLLPHAPSRIDGSMQGADATPRTDQAVPSTAAPATSGGSSGTGPFAAGGAARLSRPTIVGERSHGAPSVAGAENARVWADQLAAMAALLVADGYDDAAHDVFLAAGSMAERAGRPQ